MRLLFTGKGGKSGSWKMRGEQLGRAVGATVKPFATDCDLAVVVKRTPPQVIQGLRRWVWDIVDAYPQPESYSWTREQAVKWVRGRIKELSPTGVIWPTERMREDCDTGLPGVVVPHHHWAGIEPNLIRYAIRTVGYEGAPSYLGAWELFLREECSKRGWNFIVNPQSLADLDVVVAFRESGGYVCRHWKSGVKLANAHASGTPFVGQPECGYTENACGAEYWANTPAELSKSFDWLEPYETRREISERFRKSAYPVERAAEDLKMFLHAL